MRFAGDINYEITDNAEIEKAVDDFKAKLIEAIPTSGDSIWSLQIMFDATDTGYKRPKE